MKINCKVAMQACLHVKCRSGRVAIFTVPVSDEISLSHRKQRIKRCLIRDEKRPCGTERLVAEPLGMVTIEKEVKM